MPNYSKRRSRGSRPPAVRGYQAGRRKTRAGVAQKGVSRRLFVLPCPGGGGKDSHTDVRRQDLPLGVTADSFPPERASQTSVNTDGISAVTR